MHNPHDIDPEILISQLAAALDPADRAAFRAAAEDALTRVPCWGEGAVHRAIAALQRTYFDPPDSKHDVENHWRSKLASGPPIEFDDRRRRR